MDKEYKILFSIACVLFTVWCIMYYFCIINPPPDRRPPCVKVITAIECVCDTYQVVNCRCIYNNGSVFNFRDLRVKGEKIAVDENGSENCKYSEGK